MVYNAQQTFILMSSSHRAIQRISLKAPSVPSSKFESVWDDVKREDQASALVSAVSPRLDQLARDGDRLAISIGPMIIHHSQCISTMSKGCFHDTSLGSDR